MPAISVTKAPAAETVLGDRGTAQAIPETMADVGVELEAPVEVGPVDGVDAGMVAEAVLGVALVREPAAVVVPAADPDILSIF